MRWLLVLLLAWVAPAGVATPTFGVDEVTPAPTLWVASTGDDANPGTAARPRRTIPRTLAAGTSVLVTGPQTLNYGSPNTLLCQGTVDRPIFITGGTYTVGGEISGSYCVLEPNGPGGWVVRDRRGGGATDHVAVRRGAGLATHAVASYEGGTVSDVVFYAMTGCGTYDGTQTEAQGDNHGVTIGRHTTNVWVIDSNFSRCSGDGVQVNGGQGGEQLAGPTYIGRNVFDANRQSGVGVKEAHDTVISENVIQHMRPDRDFTNPGACVVLQYFPIRTYVLGNTCRTSENGFLVNVFDDAGAVASLTASPVFFGANVLSDIHATRSTFDSSNPWSFGWGIRLAGGSIRVLKDNRGSDMDGTISVIYPQFDGQPYVDQGGNVLVTGPAARPAAPTQPRIQ